MPIKFEVSNPDLENLQGRVAENITSQKPAEKTECKHEFIRQGPVYEGVSDHTFDICRHCMKRRDGVGVIEFDDEA